MLWQQSGEDCPCSRETAAEAVQEEISLLSSKSKIPKEPSIKELEWSDVALGDVTGVGGFSQIFKVQVHKLTVNAMEDGNLAREKVYALKCLRRETVDSPSSFSVGAIDLATEGEILWRLNHENIIQLYAVTAGGPGAAIRTDPRGYFLVLDLLPGGTLGDKLQQYRQARDLAGKSLDEPPTSEAMIQRLQKIALGLARGLEHLHQKNIVLRDLKPENVGFDENDTPKLFDFGFAREKHMIEPGEVAGSLRYMSPEAAKGQSPGLESDVHSFGVILWELLTLRKPFECYASSCRMFEKHVFRMQYRPSTASIPSTEIRRIIRACWRTERNRRPLMKEVVHSIQTVLMESEAQSNNGALLEDRAQEEGFKSTTRSKSLTEMLLPLERQRVNDSFQATAASSNALSWRNVDDSSSSSSSAKRPHVVPLFATTTKNRRFARTPCFSCGSTPPPMSIVRRSLSFPDLCEMKVLRQTEEGRGTEDSTAPELRSGPQAPTILPLCRSGQRRVEIRLRSGKQPISLSLPADSMFWAFPASIHGEEEQSCEWNKKYHNLTTASSAAASSMDAWSVTTVFNKTSPPAAA